MLEKELKVMAKGAGIIFVGLILSKLFFFLYRVIVARIGTEEYGLLSLGLVIISLMITLSLMGLGAGVLRYVSFYRGKKDEARIRGVITYSLKICFPLSLAFAFLLFIFSDSISTILFHNIKLAPLLKVLSFSIPFLVLASILLMATRAFQRARYEVYARDVVGNAVMVILTLVLVYLGFSVIGAAVAYVVAAMITFVLSLYFLEKKVFPIFKTKVKPIFIKKELFSYSWPLMLWGILLMAFLWTDTLMIGYFRTASEVGIYNAASPIAMLMIFIPTAILGLFVPVLSGLLAKRGYEKIKKIYETTTRWVFFASFPILLLMLFFSRQILTALFGQIYSAGAAPLSILSFGYLVGILFLTSGQMLAIIKKTKLVFLIGLVTALLNIILNYILIPKHGIIGGSIATAISFIICGLLFGFFAYKYTRIQPITKRHFKPLLIGVFLISLLYITTKILSVPTYALILMFGLFLLFYITLLIVFKSLDKEELKILKAIKERLKLKWPKFQS